MHNSENKDEKKKIKKFSKRLWRKKNLSKVVKPTFNTGNNKELEEKLAYLRQFSGKSKEKWLINKQIDREYIFSNKKLKIRYEFVLTI